MSDGLSWAYEQLEEEESYKIHIDSGKLDKKYLEQDIVRILSPIELRLLVVRLIIHHLGGFKRFMSTERYRFNDLFDGMGKKYQKAFIVSRAKSLGMEVGYTNKISKLQTKIEGLLRELS